MADEKHIAMEKSGTDVESPTPYDAIPIDALPKSRWERSWPTIACGAGLFSDGYIQGYGRPFTVCHCS